MEGGLTITFISVAMFVGSFLLGFFPLLFTFSQVSLFKLNFPVSDPDTECLSLCAHGDNVRLRASSVTVLEFGLDRRCAGEKNPSYQLIYHMFLRRKACSSSPSWGPVCCVGQHLPSPSPRGWAYWKSRGEVSKVQTLTCRRMTRRVVTF